MPWPKNKSSFSSVNLSKLFYLKFLVIIFIFPFTLTLDKIDINTFVYVQFVFGLSVRVIEVSAWNVWIRQLIYQMQKSCPKESIRLAEIEVNIPINKYVQNPLLDFWLNNGHRQAWQLMWACFFLCKKSGATRNYLMIFSILLGFHGSA